MSNSGVNTAFAKCFIFFMAVVILLQGVVYLGLSVWGITLRDCNNQVIDISNQPFKFAMDLIYFLNEDCGNPVVSIAEVNISVTLKVNFDKADIVENRTYIFFITYAVISALWVVTSLSIITTLCGRVTKTINALCFWPWFLAIIAGCILDVVATGYFVHDIINTTSVAKTFAYLGITVSNEKALEWLSNFDTYFITPAVVMACISSRVVLIWLLNIFGSSFCLSLSNILSKRNSSKQSSVNSLATTSTAPVSSPTQQQQPHKQFSPIQMQEQQQPPQIQQQEANVYAQQQEQLIRPEPLEIQKQSSIRPQENQNTRPYNVQSPNIYPSAPSPNETQSDSNVATTYRNTETHPDRLNYPTQRQTSQYQQELSPISPLNNRYSTTNDSFQFPMQNQRVSDELRGQLPWSYTSMPPPVPKKPQLKVYPEIPTPDYGQ